jgi:hypothetical protein
LQALLEGIDSVDDFAVLTQQTLIPAAKDTGQKIGHEGLLEGILAPHPSGSVSGAREMIKAGILSA